MSRWTLYTSPGSCALASHIALREAGAEFDLVKVDFKAGQQQSAGYLAINPKGRVPALVTEEGVLTETPALLAFIAQRHPQAQLAAEAAARSEIRRKLDSGGAKGLVLREPIDLCRHDEVTLAKAIDRVRP